MTVLFGIKKPQGKVTHSGWRQRIYTTWINGNFRDKNFNAWDENQVGDIISSCDTEEKWLM